MNDRHIEDFSQNSAASEGKLEFPRRLEKPDPVGLMSGEDAEKAVRGLRLHGAELVPETPNERTASQMVVQRLHGGTPWSLAGIPYEKRSYFGGRINKLYYTLLDGRHTVLEALRISDAMLRRHTTEEKIGHVIAFLRYLAGYGYVKVLRDGTNC